MRREFRARKASQLRPNLTGTQGPACLPACNFTNADGLLATLADQVADGGPGLDVCNRGDGQAAGAGEGEKAIRAYVAASPGGGTLETGGQRIPDLAAVGPTVEASAQNRQVDLEAAVGGELVRGQRVRDPRVRVAVGQETDEDSFFPVLGIVVLLAGALYPGAVMRLQSVRVLARHYRRHRQLAPLWNELHRAFPQHTLPRVPVSAWLETIGPWGVHRRYYRRLIECRDGPVRISPRLYAPGSTQPLAERLLAALNTIPAAREAPADTVAIAVAVPKTVGLDADARTRRPRPPGHRRPPPYPVHGLGLGLGLAMTGEPVTKALIIGAGIAGPATAIALHKAGISSELYEAYPADTASPGAFVTIPSNGQDALDAIDAGQIFAGVSFPTTRLRFLKPDGELLGEFPLGRKRPAPRSVIRADLARALTAEAARLGVAVAHGKRLISADHADRGVTTFFEDGTRASGDLLVGADGIHSVVRGIIDPDAPPSRYTGLAVATGYADSPPGTADEPCTTTMIYGSRAYLGCIAAPDGRRWWFTRLPDPELTADELSAPADQTRERIAAAFDDDPTPAADIVRATPGPITITSARDIPSLPSWHNGTMVVVGDAAHAVSPATTQGASMALEDAVTLARCLRDISDVPDALATYEQLRRERAERICQTGAEAGTNPVPPKPGVRQEGPPAWIFDHHIDWSAPVRR